MHKHTKHTSCLACSLALNTEFKLKINGDRAPFPLRENPPEHKSAITQLRDKAWSFLEPDGSQGFAKEVTMCK